MFAKEHCCGSDLRKPNIGLQRESKHVGGMGTQLIGDIMKTKENRKKTPTDVCFDKDIRI